MSQTLDMLQAALNERNADVTRLAGELAAKEAEHAAAVAEANAVGAAVRAYQGSLPQAAVEAPQPE